MIFPRLFSCPTMRTDGFTIEFEVNLIVVFAGRPWVTENFYVALYRPAARRGGAFPGRYHARRRRPGAPKSAEVIRGEAASPAVFAENLLLLDREIFAEPHQPAED